MTVMQKEDEVGKYPSGNRLPLLLSREVSVKGPLSKFLKQDPIQNTGTIYPSKRKQDNSLPRLSKKLNLGTNMLNGFRSNDGHMESPSYENIPVARLTNMGNTCYLNSILYTLRFAPSFLHNLHHLVVDLALIHSRLNQTKVKSSSLGRNISGISGPSSRSSSSKDLLSLGNSQNDLCPKTKMQVATEKLHELFMALRNAEIKESSEPFQPFSFLNALIEVNSLYQGNQQQDAHELLVYLLDILRETCDLLAKQAAVQIDLQQTENTLLESEPTVISSSTKSWGVRRSWKKNKNVTTKKKVPKEKNLKECDEQINGTYTNESDEQSSAESVPVENKSKKSFGYNFVSEDFGGVTLRRTKCLECEFVTERKEPFYDICVPIPVLEKELDCSASDFYRSYCVTSENLRDSNKYWCENCIRYNEARREVSYERLPNLLVLQLKRFSTTASGTEKMNNYMPTPLILACFCDQCSQLPDDQKLHSYQLYSVIIHVGATMASGHYIAYMRATDHLYEYLDCGRDNSKTVNFSSVSSEKGMNLFKFLKPKSMNNSTTESLKSGLNNLYVKNGSVNGLCCKSKECCGIKLSKSVIENAINNSNRDVRNRTGDQSSEEGELWLECDDDIIRTVTTKEFQKLLGSKKNNTATPYLLFYSKIKEYPSNSANSSD